MQRLGLAAVVLTLAAAGTGSSYAADEVRLLVLKERGVGSSAQAQPVVDKFVALAQKKQGWPASKGAFHTERKSAAEYVDKQKPQFGILSLVSFLAWKDEKKLEVIGQVSSSRAGGREYHLLSKSAKDLAGCKGAKLATDLSDDPKFVEAIIAKGAFKLSDFTVEPTKRPLQGVKATIRDEVKCTLVDDAVFAELSNIEGGKALASVWKSGALPPMPVIAFATADTKLKQSLKDGLSAICDGEGKAVCGEVGIERLKSANDEAYAEALAAYRKAK